MKKKGFIILGATSLVALSVLTLTSCGNKKNINFKSYSNKVSEKQFGDKLDELQEKAHVKVGDSYEGASYFFIESSASGAGESASSSSYKYVEEKYNSDDQIFSIKGEAEEDIQGHGSNVSYNRVGQIEGSKLQLIDLDNEWYAEAGSGVFNNYLEYDEFDDNIDNVFDVFDRYNESDFSEYYIDGDVITIVSESQSSGYSNGASTSAGAKGVVQLQINEDSIFVAAELEFESSFSYTGEKVETELYVGAFVDVKFTKPSISKIDVSSFTKVDSLSYIDGYK